MRMMWARRKDGLGQEILRYKYLSRKVPVLNTQVMLIVHSSLHCIDSDSHTS